MNAVFNAFISIRVGSGRRVRVDEKKYEKVEG